MLIFPKFQCCSSIIVPATPFWILKFKWVWQTQFLSHNLVTLKNYVFFKDLQMILVPFFHIPTGFQLRNNGFKSISWGVLELSKIVKFQTNIFIQALQENYKVIHSMKILIGTCLPVILYCFISGHHYYLDT